MTITNPESLVTRREMEDFWRLRLEQAQVYYREATQQYRKLLQEQPPGEPYNPIGALAFARQSESDALAEYTRV